MAYVDAGLPQQDVRFRHSWNLNPGPGAVLEKVRGLESHRQYHRALEDNQHRESPFQMSMTASLAPGSRLSTLPNDEKIRIHTWKNQTSVPFFAVKTKGYTSLRPSERPIILHGGIYYPEIDERWFNAPLLPAFGLSIVSNDGQISIRESADMFLFSMNVYLFSKMTFYTKQHGTITLWSQQE